MLARLMSRMRSALAHGRDRLQGRAEPVATSVPFAFPPMKPLSPPAARNDDVLQPVVEAVAQELRRAGHLR